MRRDFAYREKSNPSLGQINMDIDDGPSLDIELSNDEDVFVPAVKKQDFDNRFIFSRPVLLSVKNCDDQKLRRFFTKV